MDSRKYAVAALLLGLAFAAFGTFTHFAQAQSTSSSPYGRGRNFSDPTDTAISQLPATASQNIPIPVLFGVGLTDLTRNFGDPRPGGPHEGLDILAPSGTPIVSPTQAVVLSIGVYVGGGNYVSTMGPGGENFIYMHLDRPSSFLSPGMMLQQGDLIGFVGNTGDAMGGPTHLHFEIRQNRVATDPFPRLTIEYSLAQKMGFLGTMLVGNPTARADLVKSIVALYPAQFVAAQSSGITIPQDFAAELQRLASGGLGIYTGQDLSSGMRGPGVVALQDFLIVQNRGPASRALGNAGATGNFGPLTKSALVEFQMVFGISPVDGKYAAPTRSVVERLGTGNAPIPLPAPTSTPGAPTGTLPTSVPTEDLKVGSQNSNVVWLQNYIVAANKGPNAQYLGRSGSTGYFGPITQRALAEFQAAVGISPAVGYFGPLTRTYIAAHP